MENNDNFDFSSEDSLPEPPKPVVKRVHFKDMEDLNSIEHSSSKAWGNTQHYRFPLKKPKMKSKSRKKTSLSHQQFESARDNQGERNLSSFSRYNEEKILVIEKELLKIEDDSSSEFTEDEEPRLILGRKLVEKRVVIIDPKEMVSPFSETLSDKKLSALAVEAENMTEADQLSLEAPITFMNSLSLASEEDMATRKLSRTDMIPAVSVTKKKHEHKELRITLPYDVSTYSKLSKTQENKDDIEGVRHHQSGKHHLYTKYVHQGVSVLKQIKRSAEVSQTDFGPSNSDIQMQLPAYMTIDFTHSYKENKRYIIPPMTEHESHRLGGNEFLNEVRNVGNETKLKDVITVGLSYLTVNSRMYLMDMFSHISDEKKPVGKVYAARMLGRYQEYARIFKFVGGREGIVASMRFTSHCNDIIKSYIQLATLLEKPDKFTATIMELAKRHAKLGLSLKDHQVHYRPLVDIIVSMGDDEGQLTQFSAPYLFVCLISRSILLAEELILKVEQNTTDDSTTMQSRLVKSFRDSSQQFPSRKQSTWD